MENNNKIWFVIEKSNYGGTTNSYRIEKTANTVEQATTFKVHLDALNDTRVITSHNKAVEEKPLVLKNEFPNEEIPF
jgi:hypothetical protein